MKMTQHSITAQTVDGDTLVFGSGQGLFVLVTDSETKNVTSGDATVQASTGDISSNNFTFGNGDDDYVQIGDATVTATTTDLSGTATASLSIGAINDNNIAFGNGNGDHVAEVFTDTVTATGSTSFVFVEPMAPSISGDMISFGNGNADYVELGGTGHGVTKWG
jgi:hypothetical protein